MPDKEDQPPVGDCAASDEHPTAATAAARDTDSDTPHLHGPPVHAGDEFPVAVDRNDAQPERDDASELGSIDASLVGSLPRRPASPVGSVGSGPAESLQRNGYALTAVGGRALDEIDKAERPGILRGWASQLWFPDIPSRPFLSIPHLGSAQVEFRTADGHVPHAAVVHVGFLGTRNTALVSADDRGMAFSHLATRGTGALGRTVKTSRILGRYPSAPPAPVGKPIKPSTVLAFAPLPLGNVEKATDAMGLTAMLTPYLLVIVSTTPIAQTQHKSARPKDVAAHSAMTGCLAWFPAVKLKIPDAHTRSDDSKVKLAYCWSNVLTVLDVDQVSGDDQDQPQALKFKARSRWKCEEAITCLQWLSRSVLAVLTISQRLVVLEDGSMRKTEAFDLLPKHVYHADFFSKQLHSLVEQLDEEDTSLHGVVADAFYMSFKTYKGRIFLLGFNHVSIGSLSNWADRLIALMEVGDYVGAIRLATSYYSGDADKLTVGLPEDAELRHALVRDKITEIMSASLRYVFARRETRKDGSDAAHLRDLAETCFAACRAIGDPDFLFDDMYERYSEAEAGGTFLEALEPYILQETITVVPPVVVKHLVNHYVWKGWEGRLEEMICHMQTTTLDLDQVTLLCKQHNLYDALTYIWNQALGDYITPLIDLLSLLIPLVANGTQPGDPHDSYFSVNALKIFPYLSYTLTGRIYPNGELMEEEASAKAKAELYWFLFSGKTVEWPKGSEKEFLTQPGQDSEPAFPYLRMILRFDAPSLLSALNEAFEDSFLNDSSSSGTHANGTSRVDLPEEQIFGMTINRQYVVSILLDVMNLGEFAAEDVIYLNMFIARNLAKFPQYLLLSGSTLSKVLTGLCNYPGGGDLADDAQLSAEYLLSVYHPSDMPSFIPLLQKAGFYRILKRVFRQELQYGKLIATYFEDPEDQESVYDCIAECLGPQKGLDSRQLREVQRAVEEHARDLLELDAEKTASTLSRQQTVAHGCVIESAADDPALQHAYLKALIEPSAENATGEASVDDGLVEQYIRLMCRFDPLHVSDFIGGLPVADLRLGELLPTMEETGVVDAAVMLMARDGQVSQAMDRLMKHLWTLESALQGVLSESREDSQHADLDSAVVRILQDLQKYVHVGIWLCQGQTKRTLRKSTTVKKGKTAAQDGLSADEALWLKLMEACVRATKLLSPAIQQHAEASAEQGDQALTLHRSLVQHTFTALLATTSGQARAPGGSGAPPNAAASNLSFLRILRAFLANAAASSPNLSDLRAVLASIFAAYAYEESILRLSNRLLERSLFVGVNQSVQLRLRGWRPRGSTCEGCGRRVWGPGVAGGAVFEAWQDRQALEESARKERSLRLAGSMARGTAGESDSKSKGKSLDVGPSRSAPAEPDAREAGGSAPLGPLVVLACRHIYHQSCLDALQDQHGNGAVAREREYRCPIDG
ncbi:hypothetical protein UVI_02057100 [Ustilaginoidea virens]|uniref:Uncharacterized protein n=1 Tax=Ustilaginoidea virens TaxID=1159556 RepID=A0A1B5KWQ5_USTVR|nr:hypothetical protein UVI_02057100 [Ustilaginoidea virens]